MSHSPGNYGRWVSRVKLTCFPRDQPCYRNTTADSLVPGLDLQGPSWSDPAYPSTLVSYYSATQAPRPRCPEVLWLPLHITWALLIQHCSWNSLGHLTLTHPLKPRKPLIGDCINVSVSLKPVAVSQGPFCPSGTFGNVWRYLWLSGLGVLLTSSK